MKGLKKKIFGAVLALTMGIGVMSALAVQVSASVVNPGGEIVTDVPCDGIKRTAGTASGPTSKKSYWQVDTTNSARFLLGAVESGQKLTKIIVNIYSNKTSVPSTIYVCDREITEDKVELEAGEYVYYMEKGIKGENVDITLDLSAGNLDNTKKYYIYYSVKNTANVGVRLNKASLVCEGEASEGPSAEVAPGVTVTEMEQQEFPGTVGFVAEIESPEQYTKVNYQLKAEGKQAQNFEYNLPVFDEGSEAACTFGVVVENVPDEVDIKCSVTVE